jgi:hypothetical protein
MGRKPKRAGSVSPADGFETVAAPAGAVSEAQLQPPDERGGCDGPAQPCSGVAALYMHAPAAAWTLAQWVTLLAVVFGICGAWIAAAVAEYASPKTLHGMAPQPRSSAGAAPSPAPPLVRPSSAAGTLCVRYLPGCPETPLTWLTRLGMLRPCDTRRAPGALADCPPVVSARTRPLTSPAWRDRRAPTRLHRWTARPVCASQSSLKSRVRAPLAHAHALCMR